MAVRAIRTGKLEERSVIITAEALRAKRNTKRRSMRWRNKNIMNIIGENIITQNYVNQISDCIADAALEVHKQLGPGLLKYNKTGCSTCDRGIFSFA